MPMKEAPAVRSSDAAVAGGRRALVAAVLGALLAGALGFSVLRHLSYPLLWNDEAETIAYGQRILAYGYPKIDDRKNTIYELDAPLHVGRKEASDAYVGSPWGQYYFAVLGVLAARNVDDLHGRTARFRLPFALAGLAGLAAIAAALVRCFRDDCEAAAWTAAGFLGLALLSTSLALHLREARYHGLVVGLQGLLVYASARRPMRGATGMLRGSAVAVLLLCLFNTFPPVSLAWAAALAIDPIVAARRASGDRLQPLLVGAFPLLVFALAALPLAQFYEMPGLARHFTEQFGFDAARWGRNVEILGDFLIRHEPLVALLAVKALAEGLHAAVSVERRAVEERIRLSRLLAIAAALQLLAISRVPFVFERYAVATLPLLAASLVLDVGIALQLSRSLAPWPRRVAAFGLVAALALGSTVMLPAKRAELEGRIAELRVPVRGPLDFIIPRLQELREDPTSLVIATNYETSAYVVYLGSRMLIGYTGVNLAEDVEAAPDAIILRKRIPRYHAELAAYRQREQFVRESYPVKDLPFNNISELTPGPGLQVLHQFSTPTPAREDEAADIWIRASQGRERSEGGSVDALASNGARALRP